MLCRVLWESQAGGRPEWLSLAVMFVGPGGNSVCVPLSKGQVSISFKHLLDRAQPTAKMFTACMNGLMSN